MTTCCVISFLVSESRQSSQKNDYSPIREDDLLVLESDYQLNRTRKLSRR